WPSAGGRVGSAFTSPWFGGAHAPRATAVSVTPDPAIAERLVGRGVIDLSSSLRDRDHWVAVRQSVRAKGSKSAGIGSTSVKVELTFTIEPSAMAVSIATIVSSTCGASSAWALWRVLDRVCRVVFI